MIGLYCIFDGLFLKYLDRIRMREFVCLFVVVCNIYVYHIYFCPEFYRNVYYDPDAKNLLKQITIIKSWSFLIWMTECWLPERSDCVGGVQVLCPYVRLDATTIRIKCLLIRVPKRRVSNSKKPSRGAQRRRLVYSVRRCDELDSYSLLYISRVCSY